MAQLLALAPIVMSGVGTLMNMQSQRQEAEALKNKAEFDAAMQNRLALQDQANSQVIAEQERRKSKQLQSRALALAAASGASVSDPQMTNVFADIESQGNLNARARIYEGDTMAASRNEQAELLRMQGRDIARRGRRTGMATLISGISSIGGQLANYK